MAADDPLSVVAPARIFAGFGAKIMADPLLDGTQIFQGI
jgi:hypothetical protein